MTVFLIKSSSNFIATIYRLFSFYRFGDRRLQQYYYPTASYPASTNFPQQQVAAPPFPPMNGAPPGTFNYGQAAYPPPQQVHTATQYARPQQTFGPTYATAPQQSPYFFQVPYTPPPQQQAPVLPQVQGAPQVQTGSGFSPVGFGYATQNSGQAQPQTVVTDQSPAQSPPTFAPAPDAEPQVVADNSDMSWLQLVFGPIKPDCTSEDVKCSTEEDKQECCRADHGDMCNLIGDDELQHACQFMISHRQKMCCDINCDVLYDIQINGHSVWHDRQATVAYVYETCEEKEPHKDYCIASFGRLLAHCHDRPPAPSLRN